MRLQAGRGFTVMSVELNIVIIRLGLQQTQRSERHSRRGEPLEANPLL